MEQFDEVQDEVIHKARVYLDANIVNDIFTLLKWEEGHADPHYSDSKKFDMERELIALRYVLDLDVEWDLEFCATSVLEDELHNTPEDSTYKAEKKSMLMELYDLLTRVPSRRHVVFSGYAEHLESRLRRIVRNEKDVKQLVETKLGGGDVFLTLDWDDILKNKARLAMPDIDIRALSPTQFLAEYIGIDLEMLIRALHGSWTTPSDIDLRPANQK